MLNNIYIHTQKYEGTEYESPEKHTVREEECVDCD